MSTGWLSESVFLGRNERTDWRTEQNDGASQFFPFIRRQGFQVGACTATNLDRDVLLPLKFNGVLLQNGDVSVDILGRVQEAHDERISKLVIAERNGAFDPSRYGRR